MTRPLEPPHIAIRASAGSGKTFQLTNRYLTLLARGESPGHILATTFSRKAAGELIDRILGRLAGAALDDAQARELAEQINSPRLTASRCARLLADVVHQCHRLNIGTLDSFFHRIAGSFAQELALPHDWQIADDQSDRMLHTEAHQAMLDHDQPQRLIDLLRLLSAGKPTRSVMTPLRNAVENFHHLFTEAPDREAWLWLPRPTPLNRDQLHDAIEQLADMPVPCNRDGSPKKSWLKACRNLRQFAVAGQWESFYGVTLVQRIVTGDLCFDRVDITDPMLATLQPLIDHARAVLLSQFADHNRATYDLMTLFDAEYRRLQRRRGLLRFDDITHRLEQARLTGRLDEVYYRLDAVISHLLIDEFQDTSLVQWSILRPIADELTAHASADERSFFCVGDTKQAIYGWRGGEFRLFDSLDDHCHHALHWANLTKSYRSSPIIIDTINTIFTDLPQNPLLASCGPAVADWARHFHPHDTARTTLPGYVELNIVPAAEYDYVADQHETTCLAAADRIAQLHHQTPQSSIGVLVRTNATVRRLIYELHKRSVTASEEGGNPLTDSPAVNAILSLLQLADHPGDTAARFHVAVSPLGRIVNLDRDHGDDEAQQLAFNVRRRLLDQGYGPTLHQWAMQMAPACDERNFRRLLQLVKLGHDHDRWPSLRPTDFVESVQTTHVEDPAAAPVRVMTIHQAKGLQFDAVVLPELNVSFQSSPPRALVERQGELGPIRRLCRYPNKTLQTLLDDFQPMLERHQRSVLHDNLSVLYVALTRARCALLMFAWPRCQAAARRHPAYADLICDTLTGQTQHDPADSPVYTAGDPRWFDHLADDASPPPPPQHDAPRITLARSDRRRRLLLRQSPSELAGDQAIDLAAELQLTTDIATLRGTIFHRWYESIAWLDREGPPDRSTLHDIALSLGAPGDQIDDWLERFFASLKMPDIDNTLRLDHFDPAAQLFREHRFVIRDNQHVLSGSIDRLVVEPDRAVVIDYKTDSVTDDPADLDRLVCHYRPQLQAYRRAATQITRLPLDRIEARLLFVGPGRAVTL